MTKTLSQTHFNKYNSYESAVAAARSLVFPFAEYGHMINPVAGNQCFGLDSDNRMRSDISCESDNSLMRLLPSGDLQFKVAPDSYIDEFSFYGSGYQAHFGQGSKHYRFKGFVAGVSNINLDSGTATVSGLASIDATGVRAKWTDEAGEAQRKTVSVNDGKFSAYLTGLKLGTTSVELEALQGSVPVATTTVEVKLEVAPVTATATFADDVHTVVQVSGTAQPNTKVTVRHGEDDVVTVKADAEGKWSTPINAPNMPGNYELTVGQEIRGQDNGRVSVDIDYGAGVVVTSPDDDFVLEPGEPLEIEGTAPAGTEVNVYDKDSNDVLASTRAAKNNTWFASIDGLEDREYTLVAAGITKGNNRTHSDLKINPGKNSVAKPTASVEFPDDVTKKAIVKGTGVDGGTITVKDEDGKRLGSTEVQNGAWSLEIDSLGAGKHTLTIEQTGIDGTQTATTEADFGAAVTASGPDDAFEDSTATVTGTGTDGARIAITENGKEVASGTVEDGSFSIPVERIQDGEHTYTVTQTARGNTVTTAEVTLDRDAAVVPVSLTSPTSGDTYPAKSTVRFAGTGTPGATVLLDAFGGLADYTTTVAWDGSWHIDRPMNIGTYRFDVVQTAKGQESRVDGIELVEEGTPVDRKFGVSAPTSGSTHKEELVAFTGTGTPGSTITIDPKVDGLAKVTTQVTLNGKWSVNRYLGSGAYDFDVYQTTPEGEETGRTSIQINQPASVTRPFVVTSPVEGSDHKNELVTFTGTGTPGSEVRVHVSNFTSVDATAQVASNGHWSVSKWLGGGTYVLDVTQTTNGAANGSTTLHLNKTATPIDQPFAITSHADGDTFTPDRAETFRGTGAAGATVTLDPGHGLAKVTTQVSNTGEWAVAKWLGHGPYTFTVSQTTKDGVTTTLAPFTITPAE